MLPMTKIHRALYVGSRSPIAAQKKDVVEIVAPFDLEGTWQ